MNTETSFDALLPPAMANKATEAGVRKAALDIVSMFMLAVLAGAFIAMGAIFATTVSAGGAALPYGVVRLLAGLAFTLGLIIVVVAGSELFTGNNLIVMAFASGRISLMALLRNWVIVYLGNFVGALLTAYLMFVSQQYTFGNGTVFDSNLDRDPLIFTIGKAGVIPGLQEAVIGMSVNETKTVYIPVDKAYGPHLDKLVHVVNRSALPAEMVPEAGGIYGVTRSDGAIARVTIINVTEDNVTIDENHLLAGQNLTFTIRFAGIYKE